MREAIIENIALPNDGPKRIHIVGDPTASCPQVLAVDTNDDAATIRLTVSGTGWSQIAYQFGHELGHVIANNWGAKAIPYPPSHWLEEGLVEAVALFGLAATTKRWFRHPPYQNWRSYAAFLKQYGDNRLKELQGHQFHKQFEQDAAAWFANRRENLNPVVKLEDEIWPVIPWLTAEFTHQPSLLSDLCALNRWPERAALPIENYLDDWVAACGSLNLIGHLPKMIRKKLGIGSKSFA